MPFFLLTQDGYNIILTTFYIMVKLIKSTKLTNDIDRKL